VRFLLLHLHHLALLLVKVLHVAVHHTLDYFDFYVLFFDFVVLFLHFFVHILQHFGLLHDDDLVLLDQAD
jgi:hypothetical protein